jgi:hypothetical protein
MPTRSASTIPAAQTGPRSRPPDPRTPPPAHRDGRAWRSARRGPWSRDNWGRRPPTPRQAPIWPRREYPFTQPLESCASGPPCTVMIIGQPPCRRLALRGDQHALDALAVARLDTRTRSARPRRCRPAAGCDRSTGAANGRVATPRTIHADGVAAWALSPPEPGHRGR